MSDLKTKVKPWEAAVSRFLSNLIPFAQVGVIVWGIVLLCTNPFIWMKFVLILALNWALHFCYKNVQGVLSQVVKSGDSESE